MKKKVEQFLWLAPFVTFALGYLFLSYSFQSKTIKTPHFIGSSLHQAMTHASEQNLRLHIITEREHAHIEPGTILEQKPQPEASIKEKQTVYIITSRSPQQKNSPLILDRTETEIKEICETERIKQKNYYLPSMNFHNKCIAQIPSSNEPIKDSKIIVYIAQEKSPFFILPNFKNLYLNEVIDFLKNEDILFSVYRKTNKLKAPYPEDAIISSQKPLVGSFIKLDHSTHIQLQIQ